MPAVNDETSARVIIIGAGPSGLAMAIELGSRSIPVLVLDRNERAGYSPRAKTTSVRTREHMRRWGIAGKLAEASPFGVNYPSDILFVTRLAGPQIARFENAFNCAPDKDPRYAEHAQWIPQYKLEAVLREHALSLPSVRIAFGQEFVSFTQDAGGVAVRIRDVATDAAGVVHADYLVGADGARSAVRDAIGAVMQGRYGLSRHYNTIFRAPGLRDAHPHGDAIMIWQINADTPSILGPMDQDDLWYFGPIVVPPGAKYTSDDMKSMIIRSTGIDIPLEIVSSDEWVASTLIADRYSSGRAFLIGDACHLHPPFGGYGMNMGVGDAVDLGWKMAAVLAGWGGPGLLDSYEIERRQTHQFVIEEAARNHAVLPDKLLHEKLELTTTEGDAARAEIARAIDRSKRNEFYSLGVTLGHRYIASPVVDYPPVDDWEWSREYKPCSAPGCRSPHAWLEDGRSLFDTFGDGFTLLVLAAPRGRDIEKARDEAAALGAPLRVVTLTETPLLEVFGAGLALVRPDQHIAWRGDIWSAGVLRKAVGETTQAG